MTDYTLMQHQIEDAKFLAERPRACCFSGMGTGKTLTALEAFRQCGDEFLVVVAPPVALSMWVREIEDYLGLSAQIVKTGKTPIKMTNQAIVMSYDIATKRSDELARIASELGMRCTIVWDESHALKSQDAQRTQAALGCRGYGRYFTHAWLLTGTPITRWADDVFPLMNFVDPGVLVDETGGRDYERFALKFLIRQSRRFPTRWGKEVVKQIVVGSRNADRIHAMLYDTGVAVRRELEDVILDLPPITHRHLTIGLSKQSDALKEANKMSLTDAMRAVQNDSLSTVRRELGEAKIAGAVNYLKGEIEDGNGPIMVACWHTNVIDTLERELGGMDAGVRIIDGRTSGSRRDRIVADWNDGKLDILIVQIAAAGVSLNLQKGGYRVVVVEADWSPATMDQMIARLHRKGQQAHVQVDWLDSDHKIDAAIQKILGRKQSFHTKAVGVEA